MNRWITDSNKAAAFDRAFGGNEWKGGVSLAESERRQFLLDRYKTALSSRGNADYVQSFLMFDGQARPLYWLLFCTNNLRGLEEMKRAMWAVDKTGEFSFSDRDNPDQLALLDDTFSQKWLAEELCDRLFDREMTAKEVFGFVLTETPCYLFREALRTLELDKDNEFRVIRAPESRRPGTFPKDDLQNIWVRFGRKRLF